MSTKTFNQLVSESVKNAPKFQASPNVPKLKIQKQIVISRSYDYSHSRNTDIIKRAKLIEPTLLVDKYRNSFKEDEIIRQTNQLCLAELKYSDLMFYAKDFHLDHLEQHSEGAALNFNLNLLIRCVRIDQHCFRVFWYVHDSLSNSFDFIYSAVIDDRLIGIVDVMDVKQLIVKPSLPHPAALAIMSFEHLLTLLDQVIKYDISSHTEPADTFVMRKAVPVMRRKLYHFYQINNGVENV